MDFLRECYSTDMHFYADDGRTCRVRYYEVPDGTPALGFWTPFCSSNWDTGQLGYSGLGEVWPPTRQYYTGAQYGNALGTNSCGGVDVWRNGQALPPPVPTPVNIFGTPLCCDRAREFRRPADIPLRSLCALYWLATLLRSTYYNSPALFAAVARAVLFPDTQVTTVDNGPGSDPGWGIARMAEGGIVAISGTTNLRQYMDQIFFSTLVPTGWPTPAGPDTARGLSTYIITADLVDAACDAFIDPELPIFVMGHSLGGAVASLLIHKWAISGRRPGSVLLTFGQPKPGDAALAAAIPTADPVFLRLANELDYVPQLPPFTPGLPFVLPPPLLPFIGRYNDMEQAGPITRLLDNGTLQPGPQLSLPWYIYLACQAAAAGRPQPLADPHAIASYVIRLRNGCPILPPALISGWTDPPALDRLNRIMDTWIFGQAFVALVGQGQWVPSGAWIGEELVDLVGEGLFQPGNAVAGEELVDLVGEGLFQPGNAVAGEDLVDLVGEGQFVIPPPVLVFDEFDDIDTTPLVDHVPLVGGPWEEWYQFAWILSSQANILSNDGPNGEALYLIDSGASDCVIFTNILTSVSEVPFVPFRASDGDNYLGLKLVDTAGGHAYLVKREAGGSVTVVNDQAVSIGSPYVVKIVLSGTSVICTINGESFATFGVTFNETATKHGIGAFSAGPYFQDFLVEGL